MSVESRRSRGVVLQMQPCLARRLTADLSSFKDLIHRLDLKIYVGPFETRKDAELAKEIIDKAIDREVK